MSASVLHPSAADADRLDRLEAAFLRSPSATWPSVSPGTVELPERGSPDHFGEPEAWVSRYRTYGLCCRW
jgi:hypothetical protein